MFPSCNNGQVCRSFTRLIAEERVSRFMPCHTLKLGVVPLLDFSSVIAFKSLLKDRVVNLGFSKLYRYSYRPFNNVVKYCKAHTG